MTTYRISSTISNWITVMRLPFTTVALLPFGAGIFIGYKSSESVSWGASILGVTAVLFICITCYLIGEICDKKEDLLTLRYMRTKFSGGTLLVATGDLPAKTVGVLAIILLALAALSGLYICYVHSNLTLLGLGIFGGLAAVLYSLPPVRLVKRGVGELFIALCYGWLTLVTGFATATGSFPPYSYLFALPQALSIFNVILFNEFPDYESDSIVGKRNLVVLTGREFASKLYAVVAFLVAVSTILVWYLFQSRDPAFLLVTLPVVFLSLSLCVRVGILERWKDGRHVEPLCGQGILLNLLVAVTLGILVTF